MLINFRKMHGLGNDFVLIDMRNQQIDPSLDLIKKAADRRLGVGCDQVILLSNSFNADVKMEIFNPDGSAAGMCGNAARCVGDIILNECQSEKILIETRYYVLTAVRSVNGMVSVDMGEPRLEWEQIPLVRECDTRFVPLRLPMASGHDDAESLPVCVSMGNPHCVFFVGADIEEFHVADIGFQIEQNELFPEKTNVEFAQVKDRSSVRMRVWERGTGITPACGSGACATVVAAVRRSYTDRIVTVQMDGGNLHIEWRESDNHVIMTGSVTYVFEGILRL